MYELQDNKAPGMDIKDALRIISALGKLLYYAYLLRRELAGEIEPHETTPAKVLQEVKERLNGENQIFRSRRVRRSHRKAPLSRHRFWRFRNKGESR